MIGAPHRFNVAAVATDRLYLHSARAMDPPRLLMPPSAQARQAMGGDAGFAKAIAEEMAHAYRNVARELKNQKPRTSRERPAHWLAHRDKETGGGHCFDLPCAKKILAARLGMAPEVRSRAFPTLAHHDAHADGATVIVKNWQALKKLVHPDPLIDDETA